MLYPNATLRPKWELCYEKHIVRVIAIRLTDWSESKMSMWTEEKRILHSPLRSKMESLIACDVVGHEHFCRSKSLESLIFEKGSFKIDSQQLM